MWPIVRDVGGGCLITLGGGAFSLWLPFRGFMQKLKGVLYKTSLPQKNMNNEHSVLYKA